MYEMTVKVLKPFMEQTFKTNDSVRFGFITGVMPLAKAGLLSGFNNPKVCSILSTEYDGYFGFTETEVKGLLDDAGSDKPDVIDEIREWYDGYTFGKARVYNPYSVMKYLIERKSYCYWDWCTGGGLSKELVANMEKRTLMEVSELCKGREASITSPIGIHVAFLDLVDRPVKPYMTYSYLAMSGYLTAEEIGLDAETGLPLCRLRVPNREVLSSFVNLQERAREVARGSFYSDIVSGCSEAVTEDMNLILSTQAVDSSWNHDMNKASVCGLLGWEQIGAESEKPKGHGRCDVFIKSKDGNPAVVIEFKTSLKEEPAELAEKALHSIMDRGYASEPLDGPVMAVGIGIRDKSAHAICRLSE